MRGPLAVRIWSSLTLTQASRAQLAAIIRHHLGIEDRVATAARAISLCRRSRQR